jgi:shikimate kinase
MGSYNFLDTDSIIESASGKTIPEIFKEAGEEGFRDVESQVLNQVHAYVRCVISTGGGVVCEPMNWAKLQTGIIVFLDVDPELIMKRIEGTDRPLLQTDNPLATLKKLLNDRRGRYEQADVHVEVTDNMEEKDVADAVTKAVHDLINNNPPTWKKRRLSPSRWA